MSYPAQCTCHCISFTAGLMQIFNTCGQFGNFRKISFRLLFSEQNQFSVKKLDTFKQHFLEGEYILFLVIILFLRLEYNYTMSSFPFLGILNFYFE